MTSSVLRPMIRVRKKTRKKNGKKTQVEPERRDPCPRTARHDKQTIKIITKYTDIQAEKGLERETAIEERGVSVY